jgi:FAD synthetase
MKKVAMCFGTFDRIHAGHEDYFRQAKEMADELVVVVSRDATVVDIKGDLPAMSERERLRQVNDHPMVDEARLGYIEDKYKIIEEVAPDVICLGFDQEAFTENLDAELARRGLSSVVMRCQMYQPDSTFPRGRDLYDDASFTEAEYEERGLPM